MFRAGLERCCDRVAFHVYEREAIRYFAGLSSLPVWITESSAAGPERHLDWVTAVYDEIYETLGNVERIFYYDLFDFIPRQFRLFSLAADETGGIGLLPESTRVIDHLARPHRSRHRGSPSRALRDADPRHHGVLSHRRGPSDHRLSRPTPGVTLMTIGVVLLLLATAQGMVPEEVPPRTQLFRAIQHPRLPPADADTRVSRHGGAPPVRARSLWRGDARRFQRRGGTGC